MTRHLVPWTLAVVFAAVAASAAHVTPGPAVTDSNVAERVRHLRTPAEQLALANYYKDKASSFGARIDFYEGLFRAYEDARGEGIRTAARAGARSPQGGALDAQASRAPGEPRIATARSSPRNSRPIARL